MAVQSRRSCIPNCGAMVPLLKFYTRSIRRSGNERLFLNCIDPRLYRSGSIGVPRSELSVEIPSEERSLPRREGGLSDSRLRARLPMWTKPIYEGSGGKRVVWDRGRSKALASSTVGWAKALVLL